MLGDRPRVGPPVALGEPGFGSVDRKAKTEPPWTEPLLDAVKDKNARDAVKLSYNSCQMVSQMYLADLTDADLLVRPVPGANHIAGRA